MIPKRPALGFDPKAGTDFGQDHTQANNLDASAPRLATPRPARPKVIAKRNDTGAETARCSHRKIVDRTKRDRTEERYWNEREVEQPTLRFGSKTVGSQKREPARRQCIDHGRLHQIERERYPAEETRHTALEETPHRR